MVQKLESVAPISISFPCWPRFIEPINHCHRYIHQKQQVVVANLLFERRLENVFCGGHCFVQIFARFVAYTSKLYALLCILMQ